MVKKKGRRRTMSKKVSQQQAQSPDLSIAPNLPAECSELPQTRSWSLKSVPIGVQFIIAYSALISIGFAAAMYKASVERGALEIKLASAESERDIAKAHNQSLKSQNDTLNHELARVTQTVERLSPEVIDVRKSDRDRNSVELGYDDGTLRRIPFDAQVGSTVLLQFSQSARPIVVVGTEDSPTEPGRLIAFYADDPSSALTDPLKDMPMHKDPPWRHQGFGESALVGPMLVADLDGTPGDELVVVINHMQGPSRVVVYTDGFEVRSEFWHYGHLMDAIAADVHGSTLPELILWGIGNQRYNERIGEAISEPFHAAVIVIDPLNPNTGRWSMNDWMNDDPRHDVPIAYGYCVDAWKTDRPEGWMPEKFFDFDPVRSEPNTIRVIFSNGYMIEFDGDLNVLRIDPHSGGLTLDEQDPDDVWRRMWPE